MLAHLLCIQYLHHAFGSQYLSWTCPQLICVKTQCFSHLFNQKWENYATFLLLLHFTTIHVPPATVSNKDELTISLTELMPET